MRKDRLPAQSVLPLGAIYIGGTVVAAVDGDRVWLRDAGVLGQPIGPGVRLDKDQLQALCQYAIDRGVA